MTGIHLSLARYDFEFKFEIKRLIKEGTTSKKYSLTDQLTFC